MRNTLRQLVPLGVLALLPFAACYKLVPVTAATADPRSQTVLEFTDSGAEQLGGLLGSAIISARGRDAAWAADTVRMSMIATTTRAGGEQFWNGQRLSIPRSSVARIQERRLDRPRTALFALAGLALAVSARELIDGSSTGNPRPPVLPPGQ